MIIDSTYSTTPKVSVKLRQWGPHTTLVANRICASFGLSTRNASNKGNSKRSLQVSFGSWKNPTYLKTFSINHHRSGLWWPLPKTCPFGNIVDECFLNIVFFITCNRVHPSQSRTCGMPRCGRPFFPTTSTRNLWRFSYCWHSLWPLLKCVPVSFHLIQVDCELMQIWDVCFSLWCAKIQLYMCIQKLVWVRHQMFNTQN